MTLRSLTIEMCWNHLIPAYLLRLVPGLSGWFQRISTPPWEGGEMCWNHLIPAHILGF